MEEENKLLQMTGQIRDKEEEDHTLESTPVSPSRVGNVHCMPCDVRSLTRDVRSPLGVLNGVAISTEHNVMSSA